MHVDACKGKTMGCLVEGIRCELSSYVQIDTPIQTTVRGVERQFL